MMTDDLHMNAEMSTDLLVGAEAVAKFTGLTKRQVYNCLDHGYMPLFKIGKLVCARRSAIQSWLLAAEREHADHVAAKAAAELNPFA